MIKTFQTDGTTWWNRPPLGFVDTTAPPGSTQTYRIRVTDPFGNGSSGRPTTVTIPAGTPAASTYAQACSPTARLAVAAGRGERHDGLRPGRVRTT